MNLTSICDKVHLLGALFSGLWEENGPLFQIIMIIRITTDISEMLMFLKNIV